jgi:hypothetical protein
MIIVYNNKIFVGRKLPKRIGYNLQMPFNVQREDFKCFPDVEVAVRAQV